MKNQGPRAESARLPADAIFVIVTLLAAISWIFSKEAVAIMPPLLFMSARFLIAAVILAMVARAELRVLSRAHFIRGVKVGMVFGIAMSLWVEGLAASNHVGEAAFIVSLGVILVPVIAALLFKESVPRSTWIALPVACVGLALLSLNQQLRLELSQLLLLCAAALFALYFNLNTRAANPMSRADKHGHAQHVPKVPVLALTTLVLTTVAAVTGLLSTLLETWHIGVLAGQPMVWLWVTLSATVGTALRFYLQTYAQSLSPYSNGVIIMVLEPVWTALIAAAWFMERLSATQLLGCLMIFLALMITRWRALQGLLKSVFRKRQSP